MSEYQYVLHHPGDTEAMTLVRTPDPIPGIIKGHRLTIEGDDRLSLKSDESLEIVNVETYIFVPSGVVERLITHVHMQIRRHEPE